MEPEGKLLGKVAEEEIFNVIPSKSDHKYAREIGSTFYTETGHMHDITTKCMHNLSMNIANVIRSDVMSRPIYKIAVIGCMGSVVNTINLCVAVLKCVHSKDTKLEFHIYETKENKCNEGRLKPLLFFILHTL